MSAAKPSLHLLRRLSDEHVLLAFAERGRLTRAEVAATTGLSKPTVAESVRRLEAAALVVDTGERTTGRGGVGSYYALDPTAGVGLVVDVASTGIVVEVVDACGSVRARVERAVPRPATATVGSVLVQAVRSVLADVLGLVRVAVVSAADPVDRTTGRLVHLPDAPFLVGDLSPVDLLADVVDGPVLVDNDVNWAARAERDHARSGGPDGSDADATAFADAAYLYLGEGLGCAVLGDGEVARGHHGLAGEIAHLVTTGPGGQAMAFTEVFAALGLRRPGSTAIDVSSLLERVAAEPALRQDLASAVCGVLVALVALADPECVIVGGAWGASEPLLEAVRVELADRPRPVAIRTAEVPGEPALSGARCRALDELRLALVAASHAPQP